MEKVDSLVIGVETAEQLEVNLQLFKGPTLSDKARQSNSSKSVDIVLP